MSDSLTGPLDATKASCRFPGFAFRAEEKTVGSRFRKTFSIGGVSLQLSANLPSDVEGGIELRQFASRATNPEIQVEVGWADALHSEQGPASFESSATWRLFPYNDEFVFEFSSPLTGAAPYRQMRVDGTFSRAEIRLSRTALAHRQVSALEYPVCELLITNYLAHRVLGVEVHGCGLVDSEGGGFLFLGHSGAGKSTTARLWTQLRRPEILSDDRIILRLHDGELWMYGTSWHGEAHFASPKKARLKNVFILKHGTNNIFSVLPQARAVAEIFARTFPPFHNPVAIERSVEFLKEVLEVVPCYEFHFLPDQSSIASVLGFHD